MSIDWSKAPEGATHWDLGMNCRVAGWMKLEAGIWYWWPADTAYSCPKKWHESLNQHKVNTEGFIERPVLWNGTGLPPVGTVCEVCEDEIEVGCQQATILFMGERFCIAALADREEYFYIKDTEFRPIRTPEKIEAEERAKEIDSMLAEIEIDYGAGEMLSPREYVEFAVTQLRDKGYRKQEAVQ